MLLDDKDDVVTLSDPQAASNSTRERDNSPQQIFFLNQ